MKGINIIETLTLLHSLGVERVSVLRLLEMFTPPPPQEKTVASELPPEIEEPPTPPPQYAKAGVFTDFKEAQKAAKKGQKPVFDNEKEGFVLMEVN